MKRASNNLRTALAVSTVALCMTRGALQAAGLEVERAIVPLTHQCVARAYPASNMDYPVVGDTRTPEQDRWADLIFRYHFSVRNEGEKRRLVKTLPERPTDLDPAIELRAEPDEARVEPGSTAACTLEVHLPGETAAALPKGYQRRIRVRVESDGEDAAGHEVVFWVPAIAKILAGADGKTVPADVIPPGAEYADEFSGGWNGTGFPRPFILNTKTQIQTMKELFDKGVKPYRITYYWRNLEALLEGGVPERIPEKTSHSEHTPLAEGIRELALQWTFTGERDFAERSKNLLLGYVDRAERLGHGLAGRVGINGLSDSWFCNPAFKGYDLLAGTGVFSPEEDKKIRAWMQYEASIICPQVFGSNNMQCEANYPVMVAGLVSGKFKYLRFAYYPPYGMDGQLSGAFYADGFQREQQVGYHYRSINPIADAAESLLRLGFCIYDDRIHRALMNPVQCTASFRDDLGGQDNQGCRVAYLRYDDLLAAEWLRGTRNQTHLPLYYGGEDLPTNSSGYWSSPGQNMPDAGVTLLRSSRPDTGDVRALKLHWGTASKRFGRDFMGCAFFTGRKFGFGDSGVNDTLGHNCIVVDEQLMNLVGGYPQALDSDGDIPYVSVANPSPAGLDDTTGAQPWPFPWLWPGAAGTYLPLAEPGNNARQWGAMYDGVTWTRTMAAIEGGFLVVDQVASHTPRRIDSPLHLDAGFNSLTNFSALTTSFALTNVQGNVGSTAQYLALVGVDGANTFPRATTDTNWTVSAFNRHTEHSFFVRATVLGATDTQVIRAEKIESGWGYHNPFLIIRRDNVNETVFAVFVESHGYDGHWNINTTEQPRMRAMTRLDVSVGDNPLSDSEGLGLELDFGDRRYTVMVNGTGSEAVCGSLASAERFAYAVSAGPGTALLVR